MSQKGPECTTSRHWIYRYRSHLSHMGPKGVIIWWYGSGDDDMLRNMMTRIYVAKHHVDVVQQDLETESAR